MVLPLPLGPWATVTEQFKPWTALWQWPMCLCRVSYGNETTSHVLPARTNSWYGYVPSLEISSRSDHKGLLSLKETLPQAASCWSNCWIRYVIWEPVKRRVTWIDDGPILIQVTLLIKNPGIPVGLFSQHRHLNVFLSIISIIKLKTQFSLK